MDNLPWSQDLIDWMATDFVDNGYDLKRLIYQILTSKTYQLPSVSINEPGYLVDKDYVFKGMVRRRLSAEQFADAVSKVFTPLYDSTSLALKRLPSEAIENAPFPRASLVVNDPFLKALGRPSRSEEHTSELQSLMRISYAVFCLKKK